MAKDSPIPLILAVFLSWPPQRQLDFFSSDIPDYRGASRTPLYPLVNSIGTYLPYFFDFFECDEESEILQKLELAISAIGGYKLSRSDFVLGPEWEVLRCVAREMLAATGNPSCDVPCPLPLEDLTYRFDWSKYKL